MTKATAALKQVDALVAATKALGQFVTLTRQQPPR
jgi:hypothetical protein